MQGLAEQRGEAFALRSGGIIEQDALVEGQHIAFGCPGKVEAVYHGGVNGHYRGTFGNP